MTNQKDGKQILTRTNILVTDVEPDRPYSQNELKFLRERNFKNRRIGIYQAQHNKCRHFYYVKKNGRKEKEIIEHKNKEVGNCSVCWKLSKTPQKLKQNSDKLIHTYCSIFVNEPQFLTYYDVDTEIIFYKWLYEN